LTLSAPAGIQIGLTDRADPTPAGYQNDRRPGIVAVSAKTLVSCLMVTLATPERLPFLRRSIVGYCAQTYPRRELVIVTDPGPTPAKSALGAMIAEHGRDDIRVVEAEGRMMVGALRNLAHDRAAGEVCCQWDDDDLHHPERLERQLAALDESGAQAVCLQQVMQFFPKAGELRCVNWRATEATVFPGSLMSRASAPVRYIETGPGSHHGEDTELVRQLMAIDGLHALPDAPHLYVYVSHGANSFDDEHHRMLADRLSISQGMLRRREAQLRHGLRPFDFGPDPVTVWGPNGPAFVL